MSGEQDGNLQSNLKEIREYAECTPIHPPANETSIPPEQRVIPILRELARQTGESDEQLDTKLVTAPNIELTIGMVNSRFYTSRYSVTVKASRHNGVEVTASDGMWEQSANQNGLWADWADEQILYEGPFVESRIRNAIEQSIVEWYRRIKENGQSGLPAE